jgi:hypothetical protein
VELLLPSVRFFPDIADPGDLDMPAHGGAAVEVIAVQELGFRGR